MSLKPGIAQIPNAGRPFKIDNVGPFKLLRMLSAPVGAVVQISTVEGQQKSPFVPWLLDEVLTLDKAATGFFVQSTIAGDLVFQWSLNDKLQTVTRTTGGGGGGIVEGPYANFTCVPISGATPPVLNIGAFSQCGPADGINEPLGIQGQGANQNTLFSSLSVGLETLNIPNFSQAAGGATSFSRVGLGAVTLVVTGAWTAAGIGDGPVVTGSGAVSSIPVWDSEGNYHATIPGNGTYYTNASGHTALGINFSQGGAVGTIDVEFVVGATAGSPILMAENPGIRRYDSFNSPIPIPGFTAIPSMIAVPGFKYVWYGWTASFTVPTNFSFTNVTGGMQIGPKGILILSGQEEGIALFEGLVGSAIGFNTTVAQTDASVFVRSKLVRAI